MQISHVSDRILRPVRGWFIAATLLLALLLNMVPLAGLPGVPDFVALVLAFWCLREPLKIGMGIAFLLGLGMDIADASIIGQHTMAYVLLAYAANSLSRRILWFPLLQQALQIFPLLLLAQAVMLAIRLVTGASFPGLSYFLGCIIATLLWYPLTYLLLLPQYQPEDKDENRPI
ncbi:MAG: rod shape-determining protein MreD [Sterolibacterium sp.]|jgi:rod shape-determining protein MreD|nr:rod shape-determining protein MreD [Sterolibacterium sp.]